MENSKKQDETKGIFTYVAMRGLPFWAGDFYVIDVAKNNYLTGLLEEGKFKEADRYLISNKFIADFLDNGALKAKDCISFGHYDWSEYAKCYTDACYCYLLDFYYANHMYDNKYNLEKSEKWWGERILVNNEQDKSEDFQKSFIAMAEDLIELCRVEWYNHQLKSGLFIGTLYNKEDMRKDVKSGLVSKYAFASGMAYNDHLIKVRHENRILFEK